jgi:hypothetical protein
MWVRWARFVIQRPVLGRIQPPANPHEMAVLALFPPLGGEILKKPPRTMLYYYDLSVTMSWQLIMLGP